MFINFSDIPRNQNLFLDYLYEFENVEEFYKHNFRNRESFTELFDKIIESRKNLTFNIHDLVKNQYNNLPLTSSRTQQNIELLKNPKTLAIVTGQQLGVIGGPLYTIYKIVTAIKLASHLSERYSGYNFVPVFWMEGDDHDFNEVHQISFPNKDNNLVTIKYKDDISDDEIKPSIGKLKIDESISAFFNELDENLRDSDFKPELLSKLKSFYNEGKTFNESFRELLFWLFDEKGLIIFNPIDDEVKKVLKDIYLKEVLNFREHTQVMVSRSAKLEEIYHAQVKVKPVNLFYQIDEGRHSVEPVEDIFKLKRKRKQFTKEEILDEINLHPERFSANVLLRPVCQDYLFPTALYVAGPSEISYFAQITPIYEFFGIECPIVYPRSSATIVEKAVSTFMDKYELELYDVFMGSESLKEKVLSILSDNKIDQVFEEINNQIELSFDTIKENLFAVDKTLADASLKYKERVFNSLNELKAKTNKAQEKKYETTLRQLEKLAILLYPKENLQERELSFVYFYSKYGREIINRIFESLEINQFEHQLISI